MTDSILRRLLVAAFGVALIAFSGQAEARNIPGSAASVMPELTRTATNMIVRNVNRDVVQMRRNSAVADVSRNADNATVGLAYGGDGHGVPASASLSFRSVDTDTLDGSVLSGSALLGFQSSGKVLVFGGLVTERLDVKTKFDNGTIKNSGYGFAIGADYAVSDQINLTGLLGVMKLDYDVSRNAGVNLGAFSADRTFVALNADYLISNARSDLRLDAGLLYLQQRNKGYVENTGGVVAPFTESQLSASFGARNEWGSAGQMRPFVEGQGWFNLSESGNAAPVFGLIDGDDWAARIGAGFVQVNAHSSFDIGVGANFGEDGFEGPDAHFSYALKF